jgi:hypothetical protein
MNIYAAYVLKYPEWLEGLVPEARAAKCEYPNGGTIRITLTDGVTLKETLAKIVKAKEFFSLEVNQGQTILEFRLRY